MPKLSNEKQFLPFIKGLITEASPFTYPEGATLDEANFVLNRDGSRERRLGLQLDTDGALIDTPSVSKLEFFSWPFAGGTNTTIGVIRADTYLWFLDMTAESPTANLLNGGDPVIISGLSTNPVDGTIINNSLVLVSSGLDYPILLEYIPDSVTNEEIKIELRDFWGVDDSLAVNERPTSLTDLHKYNLRNQGWTTTIQTTCGTDALDCTYNQISKYPSNADVWTAGKVATTGSDFEKYSPATLLKNSQDWMQAPKGKYILDIYNRGTSRISQSGITGLGNDSESGRITTVTTFSGRLFYSGIQSVVTSGDKFSPNYSGYIFFTQSVVNKDRLSRCYQEADPTSPDISDLIDTDGGTIHIPEASKIVKLLGLKSSLLVFAENGVWEVFASETGFKATEYQINKISNVGINSTGAVVEANDTVVYWAKSGIYFLSVEKVSGRVQSENISIRSIQRIYQEIPDNCKQTARSFFEEVAGRIRWLFSSNKNTPNTYDRELVLDLSLQAFSLNIISTIPYKVVDYVPEVNLSSETSRNPTFSFLTTVSNATTFSSYSSFTFLDWGSQNYSSYLVTGYEMFGDIMRKKQAPIILFYFKKTETGFDEDFQLENASACIVQAQWNWSNSANSGKWGSQFKAYRFNRNYIPENSTFDWGENVIVTKNRLRGTGRCLSLKIESEEGKDMHILGWGIQVLGKSLV